MILIYFCRKSRIYEIYIDIYILVNDFWGLSELKDTAKWELDWNDSFIEETECEQNKGYILIPVVYSIFPQNKLGLHTFP